MHTQGGTPDVRAAARDLQPATRVRRVSSASSGLDPDQADRGRPDLAVIADRVRRSSPLWCFALAAALVLVPNWPGRINNDTIGMLQQIDRHRISDWHSPVLQYLYMPVRELGAGISPAFAVNLMVAFAALLLIFENFGLSRLKSSLLALGTCLFPVTYGLLIAVTRDAWFMTFWLLALGLARTHRITGGRRCALLFVVLFFAYAARQNAIGIAPALFAAALWDPTWAAARRLAWWLRGVVATALSLLVVAVMSLVVMALPVREQNIDGAIYLFDLIRLSVRNDEMLLPPELNPNGLTVEYLQENTQPWRLDDIVYNSDVMPVRLDASEAALAEDVWFDFVKERPGEFLRMRWQVMTYQIGLGGNTRNPFIGGMIPNPYGIHPSFPQLFDAATDYQLTFNGGAETWQAGVVHRLWPVLVLSIVAAGAAATRRRGAPYAIDALLSASGALVLIFAVAPQVHFRYVGPVYVVLGIACLGLLWPWTAGRRGNPSEVAVNDGDALSTDEPTPVSAEPVLSRWRLRAAR
jgi:hypothetical protein